LLNNLFKFVGKYYGTSKIVVFLKSCVEIPINFGGIVSKSPTCSFYLYTVDTNKHVPLPCTSDNAGVNIICIDI